MSRLRALLLALLVGLAVAPTTHAGLDFEKDTSNGIYASSAVCTDYPFTVSCFFTPETNSGITQTLVGIADNAVTNRGIQLAFTTGSAVNAFAGDGSGTTSATTTNTSASSARVHCCGIFTSATDRRSILAGVWASSGTSSTSRALSSLDNTSIGIFQSSSPGNPTDGVLDNVAIYNVALSQAEVESLAAGENPYQIQRGHLVFFVPCVNPNSGPHDLVNDRAVNNGTAPGTAQSVAHVRQGVAR